MNWVPCRIVGCLTCREHMKKDPEVTDDKVRVAELRAKAEAMAARLRADRRGSLSLVHGGPRTSGEAS